MMPPLSPTLASWSILAKRWRKANPTRDPGSIPVEERREGLRCRAAFWCATKPAPRPGLPSAEACQACGEATHSWCEGCYARHHGLETLPFAAICSACDRLHLVCPDCEAAQISWEQGHQVYETHHGAEGEEVIEVAVSPSDPPVRLNLRELAMEFGRPAEELRAEIIRALGGSPTSSS